MTRRRTTMQTSRRSTMAPSRNRKTMMLSGSGGRSSMGKSSMSRSSMGRNSLGNRLSLNAVSRKVQDPRKFNQKGYVAKTAKQLIEFLSINEFPMEISFKMVTSPSTKLFVEISTFLFSYFDPEFEFEDWRTEFPQVMLLLGYPTKVRSHSLQNIASPHAWPQLLGALKWITEVITYRQILDSSSNALESVPEISQRMFVEYIEASYSRFMQGEDLDVIESDLLNMCDEKAQVLEEDIAELENANQQLSDNIQQFEGAKVEFLDLLEKRERYKEDCQKFVQGIERNEISLETLNEDIESSEVSLDEHLVAMKPLLEKRDDLRSVVDNQPLSTEDVDRMRRESQILDHNLEEYVQKEELMKTHIWELEMEISNLLNTIDKSLDEFNSRIDELSRNAHFECPYTRVDFEDGEFSHDLRHKTKQFLAKSNATFKEEARQNALEGRQLLETLNRSQKIGQDKKDGIDALEEQLRKIETAVDEEHTQSNQFLKEIVLKIQDIELQLLRNRNLSNQVIEAQNRLEELEIEVDRLSRYLGEKERETINDVMEAVEILFTMKRDLNGIFVSFHNFANRTVPSIQ